VLDLSEHHGDGTLVSWVRVGVTDLRNWRSAEPGLHGSGAGNRLTFYTRVSR
jgi:hypothetical protein